MSQAQPSSRDRLLEGLRRSRSGVVHSARRSQAVIWAKWLLPTVAGLLLVMLAVAPNLHFGAADRVVYHPAQASDAAGQSTMQSAKYHGVDQHGQPFTLTASEAAQRGADDLVLALPEGDITLSSGAWLMLKSSTGLFNQKSQWLALSGDVTLYRNDGTVMTAPRAALNLHEGSANSSDPVNVQGPFGTLYAAHGFTLTGRGSDVRFIGPVSLTLTGAQLPGPDPRQAASPVVPRVTRTVTVKLAR